MTIILDHRKIPRAKTYRLTKAAEKKILQRLMVIYNNLYNRNSDSESDEGTWLDTTSDSDDSSSDSDLDIGASQRKSYRRKRAVEKLNIP